MYSEQELLEIWDSIKYDINFSKEVNKSKLLRQLEIFKNWMGLKGNGYVEACTRFGKNMIAFIAIKRLNLKSPESKTIVVVPTLNLYEDWTKEGGHIQIFNLKNVEVYVINSYVTGDRSWNCTLLIIDEIHRASNEDSQFFSKTILKTNHKYKLGLSATLDKSKKVFLESYGMKRAGLVSIEEAERKGWVAKHYIYNLGLELQEEENIEKSRYLNEVHDTNFAKFEFNWGYATSCRIGDSAYYYNKEERLKLTGGQWKRWYAERMGWLDELGNHHKWSPKSLSKYAQQWGWAMNERKAFLYNAKIKVQTVKELVEYLNLPTIIFSESTSFADEINFLLEGRAKAYHSKVPTEVYSNKTLNRLVAISFKDNIGDVKYKMIKSGEILDYKGVKKKFKSAVKIGGNKLRSKIKEDFNLGKIDVLSTVKSLDEGFDSDRVQIGIIASAKSKELQNTQRMGRSLNSAGSKESIIINLYIKDSQDEKWLKSRQMSIAKGKIKNITSINQIDKL